MTRKELIAQIEKKQSMLCVGLDTDLDRIPKFLLDREDPIFEFNKAVIDATAPYAVAYKPNTAFYEAYGIAGWKSFERTVQYLKSNYPEQFIIADAKRGDIGNTAARYAKAFLETLDCDSITVAPYMGEDSVVPFRLREGKWVIALGLTSNPGADDVQKLKLEDGRFVHREVMNRLASWLTPQELMFVVGATRPEELGDLRRAFPEHFFLVPGVGAQGGSAEEVIKHGLIPDDYGLLVNSSRGIIYASSDEDFAEKAGLKAREMKEQMSSAF